MELVRVWGRPKEAELVRAALVAAGAEVNLVDVAPMHLAATTGQDGTGVDVLVGAVAAGGLKANNPARPVVAVVLDQKYSEVARAWSGLRSGADAVVDWPASGESILAACAEARAKAGRPRPRWSWEVILAVTHGRIYGTLLVLAAGVSGAASQLTQADSPVLSAGLRGAMYASVALFSLLQALLVGLRALDRSLSPRSRVFSGSFLLVILWVGASLMSIGTAWKAVAPHLPWR